MRRETLRPSGAAAQLSLRSHRGGSPVTLAGNVRKLQAKAAPTTEQITATSKVCFLCKSTAAEAVDDMQRMNVAD